MPIPVYNNAHTLSLFPHRAYRKDPKIRFCKSLKIKGHFSQKIQGTYFKISALYFKIYGLYFLQDALCFFQRPMSRFFCAQCAAEISVFVARLVLANSKNARDSR